MRVKVVAGEVEVTLSGVDLTPRQVSALVAKVAGISVALAQAGPEMETEQRAPIGFSAHIDLDPERNLGEDLSDWFEESP